MYGLPQAGRIANDLIKKRLAYYGYFERPHTPGLWKHFSRPTQFTLVVDDFGIKYVGQENLDHLLMALRKHYEVSLDEEGSLYCGITLEWDYKNRTLDISMPGYVEKQLIKYKHDSPKRPQHNLWEPRPIKYGAAAQETDPKDTSPPLDDMGVKFIQQMLGSF